MGEILQQDQTFIDQIHRSSVGCSNDERYSNDWKTENYIMVTLLSVIGIAESCLNISNHDFP